MDGRVKDHGRLLLPPGCFLVEQDVLVSIINTLA